MTFKTLAFYALIGLGTVSAQASELPDGPHVVTSGAASVNAVPDMATLAIEVSVSAKDAVEAKRKVDDRVANYMTFLQKNGVNKKDIHAANLSTQPEYEYLREGKTQLKGYRAVRQVEVTLHQLDKVSPLLDGALKAGLNEIRSVSFGVSEPEEFKNKARQAAIDDAIKHGQQLAEGFNGKLGPVYSIRYHVASYQPAPIVHMMKADSVAPVSAEGTYDRKSIQFNDQVDVVFELERSPTAAPGK